MRAKVNVLIVVEEQHLMDKVHVVLEKILLEMSQFLVLLFHHLILIVEKNKFLVLGEGPTQDIHDGNGAEEKKENTKFCLGLQYNGDESYLYINKTEIHKIKVQHNI